MTQEVDGTIDEHPPEVCRFTLEEEIGAGLDENLGTPRGQLRELAVGQPVEEADRAKLVGVRHVVAGSLMR
jgi:hypothetical protein